MISNSAGRRDVGACGRGFSLLEILIAALILAIVTVPLFTSLHTGHQGTEKIIEDSLAASLGTTLLEKLQQVPFSKLPAIVEEITDNKLAEAFGAVNKAYAPVLEPPPAGALPEYRRLVSIETVSQRTDDPALPENSPWGALKLIRVRVEWKPDYLQGKSVRSLVFQSLVTDDTEVW
jgi:prepilin-type N-terminal cleavage/methylation domain-containing protein